ncbi:MAG: zinc-binding dehydrogenase [Aquincola sp.]|nr:zinc-binding dehydrogenase [Aquincola sp.]
MPRKRNLKVEFVLVQSSGQDMATLRDMANKGMLKPHVSKTFKCEDVALAHEQLESGRTVGKVVVVME